ncbi:ferric iron reductase protein FhuF [Peribacillus deserti]|uniref:Ferric iron reductase protein FhuF n=1 Tax=Peribacillus deserti TaxID=673318 RepID=A0ABS2QIS6_9BACI|nr:(2Fe-2S)-binding protein [Peribacillus deserti]MBM7693043.1 ferric iron reductase protein FhuF [Peribacillus deserti]
MLQKQKEAIWQELERFNVVFDEKVPLSAALEDLSALFDLVSKRNGTEKPFAIASVLMRHTAFIFVAQLYILSKYRMIWTGNMNEIRVIDREIRGRWLPQWLFPEGNWRTASSGEEVSSALKRIISKDCRSLVKSVAKHTNSSPSVLWENVWGYVLWMYVQLMQSGEDADRARNDITLLLEPDIWQGMESRSPFSKFLNGQTPEESMAAYARVTCCLYYLIPGNESCSYCPRLSKDQCLQD